VGHHVSQTPTRPAAVLYDEFLQLKSVEELRAWDAKGVDFVVLDSETGEDVTRVLLA
jgi:hypothetical protein